MRLVSASHFLSRRSFLYVTASNTYALSGQVKRKLATDMPLKIDTLHRQRVEVHSYTEYGNNTREFDVWYVHNNFTISIWFHLLVVVVADHKAVFSRMDEARIWESRNTKNDIGKWANSTDNCMRQ